MAESDPLPRGAKRERLFAALAASQADLFVGRPVTAYRMAATAQCTPQHAYDFAKGLEDEGVLAGLKVKDARRFFVKWLAVRARPKFLSFEVPNPRSVLKARQGSDFALTTYAGESLLTHYLAIARWDLYVPAADVMRWASDLTDRAGALRGPGNVRLLAGDPFWCRKDQRLSVSGLQVVSPARLVVDLLAEGGVAREAAERLLSDWRWTTRTRTRKRA